MAHAQISGQLRPTFERAASALHQMLESEEQQTRDTYFRVLLGLHDWAVCLPSICRKCIICKISRMKFKDGYLCSEEDVEKLPVEVLEDIIIHVFRDDYLNQNVKEDLLELYLKERKDKLDKTFSYTEKNLQRLRDMNELIERQSKEALLAAWQLYQDELAEKTAHPETYRDVAIKPMLSVPENMYYEMYCEEPGRVFTEKEEEVWKVLCSSSNFKYMTFPFLVMSATFLTKQPEVDLQATIREVVYGCQGDEVPTPWGMAGLDWEQIKGICFNWPFHTLFEHCAFAITDILKIKKFDIKIEMTDEVL